MSTANKRKGQQYEADLLEYFRGKGYDAELLRLKGSQDEGDLVVKIGGVPFVFEAKNWGKLDLSGWVQQAEVEAGHYASHRKIDMPFYGVLNKRRNHGIAKSYVIVPLDHYLEQVTP